MDSRPLFLSALISLFFAGSAFAEDASEKGGAATSTTAQASTPASTPAATPASTPAATPVATPAATPDAAPAAVDEGPSIVELIPTKEFKAVWAAIFKGEYSPSRWIETLDATGSGLSDIKAGGKTYSVALMNNINNPKGNKFVVAFSEDRKKGWGVELTVPLGIGRDAVYHPKKYATIRYFNNPDASIKKVLMDYLGRDPKWN